MSNPELHIKLSGDASGVLKAIQDTKNALSGLANSSAQVNSRMIAQGVALGQMFLEVGKKALSMAKDGMSAFTSLAGEVRALGRVMQGTPEDLSRIIDVANDFGVSVDTLVRSMGIASKHFLDNDKAVKQLGVSYKNADGSIKPALQLIGELSDRFKHLKDPMERAGAARDLFGRGYKEMLPLLMLGSERINKLAGETDKLGLALSKADLEAAKQFKVRMNELKDTIQGVWVQLGRAFLPVVSEFIQKMADAAQAVVRLYKENETFARIVKASVAVLGVAAVAAMAYKTYVSIAAVAVKTWAAAQRILNAVLTANPVTLIVLAVLALIAALIILVKNFEPVGDAVIAVSGVLGNILGKVVGGLAVVFKTAADAVLSSVDYILMGIGWLAEGLSWLTGGIIDATGTIDKWRGAIKSAKAVLDDAVTNFAGDAWSKGEEYGRRLGQGLVDAIKKLKVPDLASLFGGKETLPGIGDAGEDLFDVPEAGAGGARKQADRVKEFFRNLVDNARKALEAAKQAAIDAKKQMDDLGRSVGDSLRQAFSITDIAESIGGAYGGPNRLLATYRKRLADMRDFVANVKRLKELGLPPEMLQDIVNAGVAKGAALARMLVANPAAITELGALQEMMRAETAAAGTFVAEAVMGERVAGLTTAAIASQTQFNQYLGYARQGGYVPTQQDIAASQENIYNSVYMDVSTELDPAALQRAIDWALATGAAARRSRGRGGTRQRTTVGTGMPGITSQQAAGSSMWSFPTLPGNSNTMTPGSTPLGPEDGAARTSGESNAGGGRGGGGGGNW